MSETVAERRARIRSGIPKEPDPSVPPPKRLLTNHLFWIGVALLFTYAILLVLLYQQVVPDREVPGGRLIGLGTEALPKAAWYAALTAIPLSLIFFFADRFRPQRLWIWLLVFGWGACVATFVSANVNSWAASQLSIIGDGDPATGARAAIFVAPFVEESTKATVLFGIAILMRYRMVSRISGIVLAGLSGVGFAFVENILYYGRVYRYVAQTFGPITPLEAMQSLAFQRGLLTCFGHPLFTSMAGIGLAIAIRHKSKVVRIVAPVAGFCAAAFLHMAFNTTATLVSGPTLMFMYFGVALPLVLAMIIFVVRQMFREGRLIRERLTDYHRLGWLLDVEPQSASRLRTRLRALWHALFLGPYEFIDTVRAQRTLTELAYLRDAITRGIIDDAGLRREKILLARMQELRGRAVLHPTGRARYPKLSFRRKAEIENYPAPSYPGPAGIGGYFPAPNSAAPGSVPLGQTATQYSEVDPNWKPPSQ
ncbi:PrsW family intramembrane metalloprotease [Microlunatus parietis]|uniref:RsiW-degrading membrane proteinase PrsW (M82 family) n=1 Tax=Microlunatus parietis TaxID=682979 RepID=A0A7Y9LAX0_9ACTN|nr:PrsW family intramembrane metalloprotease [Microlunatus parietis]NYE70213.1 RsiW-degrading membrane proteinase PrsW (M82 family) [Microlunatus parietis]